MTKVDAEGSTNFSIKGHHLMLRPTRTLYLPDFKTLFLSDVHLGKATHFRKHGLAIPGAVHQADMDLLTSELALMKPSNCVFLGDLFHSEYNQSWETFRELVAAFPSIKFTLVKGNHDILKPDQYAKAGLHVTERITFGPLAFTHHPQSENDFYNISGHVHPGVMLYGAGKQKITVPCFYFGKNQGILPAFGAFTGLARIKILPMDDIFAVVNQRVIYLPNKKEHAR